MSASDLRAKYLDDFGRVKRFKDGGAGTTTSGLNDTGYINPNGPLPAGVTAASAAQYDNSIGFNPTTGLNASGQTYAQSQTAKTPTLQSGVDYYINPASPPAGVSAALATQYDQALGVNPTTGLTAAGKPYQLPANITPNTFVPSTPAQYAAAAQQAASEGFVNGATGQPIVSLGTTPGNNGTPSSNRDNAGVGGDSYSSQDATAISNADDFGMGALTSDPGIANAIEDQEQANGSLIDKIGYYGDDAINAVLIGGATAGLGDAVGAAAAGAGAGSVGGGIVGGATAGAAGTVGSSLLNGGGVPSASAIGKGALVGGITGGVRGIGATNSLSNGIQNTTGLGTTASNALAGGLVQGVVGAGVGALSGALSGTGAAHGAEVGGAQGAVNGAVSGATGSGALGSLAGTGAGIIASRLTNPSPAPASSTPAPVISGPFTPPVQTATNPGQSLGSLPTDPGYGSSGSSGTSNIGSYSGFAPRQALNTGPIDWDTYGQGPEVQFFNGESGASLLPSSGTSDSATGTNLNFTTPGAGVTSTSTHPPVTSIGGNPLGTTQIRPSVTTPVTATNTSNTLPVMPSSNTQPVPTDPTQRI